MQYDRMTERDINLMISRRSIRWTAKTKKYFRFVKIHYLLHSKIINWKEPFRYVGMYILLTYIKMRYGKKAYVKYVFLGPKFWMRWFRFQVYDVLEEIKDVREFMHRNRALLPNLTFMADLDLKIEQALRNK